jgi:hypothetical protein
MKMFGTCVLVVVTMWSSFGARAQVKIEYNLDSAVIEAVERNVLLLDSLYGQDSSLTYYMYVAVEDDGVYKLIVNAIPENRMDPRFRFLLANTNRTFRTRSRVLPVVVECDNLYYVREKWRIPMSGFYIEMDYREHVLGSGVLY